MEFVYAIIALTIAILLFVIPAVIGILFWKRGQPIPLSLLSVTVINNVMQVTVPTVYGVFMDFPIERSLGLSPANIVQVLFLHLIYYILFVFVFLNRLPLLRKDNAGALHWQIDSFTLKIFLVLGLWQRLTTLDVSGLGGYQANEQVILRGQYSPPELVSIYLNTMFGWTTLACSAILFVDKETSRYWRLLSAATLLLYVLRQTALGLRGGVFIVGVLLAFLTIAYGRTRGVLYFFLAVAIIAPVFTMLGSSYRIDVQQFLVRANTFERLAYIAKSLASSQSSREDDILLENLMVRLQATRHSVALIRLYDNGKGAGLKPMTSALAAVVPGWLWPSKPYPTSSTDDASGSAMYVSVKETNGRSDMGPYLTSAHAYWEGGIIWLIACGLATGWLWNQIVKWSYRRKDGIVLLVLVMLLDAHHGEMEVLAPIPSIIRLFWYSILPVLLFVYAVEGVRIAAKNLNNLLLDNGKATDPT